MHLKKSINRWKWIKMAFKLSIFKKVQSKDDLICQPINIFPYSVFKYWIVNGILKCNCKIGSENGFLLFYLLCLSTVLYLYPRSISTVFISWHYILFVYLQWSPRGGRWKCDLLPDGKWTDYHGRWRVPDDQFHPGTSSQPSLQSGHSQSNN